MRKQRPSSIAASALASATLAVFVLASVLSLSVLVYRSGGEEDQNDRNRRSSNLRDEYLYRNRIHRVLWAKRPSEKSAYLTPDESSALSDTFIAVKTTGRFHRSRLGVVLKTWFNLAKEQVNGEKKTHSGSHIFRREGWTNKGFFFSTQRVMDIPATFFFFFVG